MHMRYKILLLCFALGGGMAFAQFGEVGGVVTDTITGEPLGFANISLEQGDQIITQSISDENGKYLFSNLNDGIYSIQISYVGYAPARFDNIKVRNKELTVYHLKLHSGSDLPVVFVFPDRIADVPDGRQIIDIKDLRETGARDPGQIVAQSAAGVYAKDGGDGGENGGGLYISGSRSDATLYVVDGIRVIGSTYVPKSAIANITVYTGGIPANYGDFTGGVIEITTRGFAGN